MTLPARRMSQTYIVRKSYLKGNAALNQSRSAAHRIPLEHGEWNVVFHIFYCYYAVWTNFLPPQKHKQSSCAIFQNFYPGKRTFGPSISMENIETIFFGYLTKNVLNFHDFLDVMFRVLEILRTLSDPSWSHIENNVVWVHGWFPWRKTR